MASVFIYQNKHYDKYVSLNSIFFLNEQRKNHLTRSNRIEFNMCRRADNIIMLLDMDMNVRTLYVSLVESEMCAKWLNVSVRRRT